VPRPSLYRRVAGRLDPVSLLDNPIPAGDSRGGDSASARVLRPIWVRALEWIGPLPSRRPDRAWFRTSSWPNAAWAAFLSILAVIGTAYTDSSSGPVVLVVAMLAAVTPLALFAWRPRLCEWLLVAAMVCWTVGTVMQRDTGTDLAAMVAIYTIGTKRTWRRTFAALAATLAAMLAVTILRQQYSSLVEVLASGVVIAAVYSALAATGLYLGTRRAYIRTLVERTEDLERERELLERERDLMARQAVAVERARIARELHDVVAHHVSVMVIQAGAAQASLPPDAGAAGQAIEAIRETGREAMAEMRRLLGLLRSEEAAEGEAESATAVLSDARAPQPGVTDLEALVERTREAGISVALEIVGSPSRVPAGVDLSVYRVAQEALTNTLRHAGPGAQASLRLRFEPDWVSLECRDDGHGKPALEAVERRNAGLGHGLVGMRERVALFGGTLEAGPIPGGGYRVLARFPIHAEVDG
jgi:signal transduction histidine kinase